MKLLNIIIMLAILFVIGGFVLPTDYSISRTALIGGDQYFIHEYVSDLDKWPEWTAWKKADTSLIIRPGDASSGMGASQTWEGKGGFGSLVFTDSSPEDGIKYDMVFDGTDKAKGVINYRDAGVMTQVTWSMTGSMENTLILGPYLALSMDWTTGRVFQQSLDELKKQIEAQNY